jgi:hypothetical protein
MQLPISQNVERKIKAIAVKMSASLEVGFLEGAIYSDGTPVASVAFWNEFGHGGNFPAPPRPFFRPMIAKESPSWPAKMAALVKATDGDGPKIMVMMGEDIQGALIDSIRSADVAPLSDTTLALRAKFGNSPGKITLKDVLAAQRAVADGTATLASGTQAKPLDWTGHMLNSTGYRVIK